MYNYKKSPDDKKSNCFLVCVFSMDVHQNVFSYFWTLFQQILLVPVVKVSLQKSNIPVMHKTFKRRPFFIDFRRSNF